LRTGRMIWMYRSSGSGFSMPSGLRRVDTIIVHRMVTLRVLAGSGASRLLNSTASGYT
jgi:hypothetical protein